MKTRTFSVQLQCADTEKIAKKNDDLLSKFDEKVNKFLSENNEFTKTEWLQSSAASQGCAFTTVSIIVTAS